MTWYTCDTKSTCFFRSGTWALKVLPAAGVCTGPSRRANWSRVEVEVTLRLTVSQSVCLGIEYPCGTCDQILFPVGTFLSEICGLVSMGHPLWREHGSTICGVITQWPESLRTRNRTLLSHLRLPQPGGPGSRIYIPREQGGPVIPSGTGFVVLTEASTTYISVDILRRTQYTNRP
jgi:hypothetical protein